MIRRWTIVEKPKNNGWPKTLYALRFFTHRGAQRHAEKLNRHPFLGRYNTYEAVKGPKR